MAMQPQWTVARKHTSIPLDQCSVAKMEAACAKVPGCGKLRPRSYIGQDGAGWSFQSLFDVHKSWPTLKAEMPHGKDSGLQTLRYTFVEFILFWPGCDPRGFAFKINLGSPSGPGVMDYGDLVLEIARCYDAFFRVPEPVVPPPSTSFRPTTQEDIENDPVFNMPDKVSPEARVLLKSFQKRFPYPSEMQCRTLSAALGYDVTLMKIWFEKNRYSGSRPSVAPKSRLQDALASRK
uniref:Guanine nucleotide-binding protein alpha-4 subunit n=1 Tax=Ganoderma boninense TaxID=34458 RepID=A0A5K1K6R5_9APHY|nr:Guanine nucleotide-binding protein alpha-4 subunit [Ganoderma boninense]